MSESARERETPSREGAFGPPPGAPQWSEPRPPQSPPTHPVPQQPNGQGYAPPSGQPHPPAPQPPPYQQGYPPAYQLQPAYVPQPAYAGYAPTNTTPFPVSTFVLLIVSVISIIATGILGIPSAILAVMAWRQNAQDPTTAKKRTTRAWIVYAINFAIAIPLLIWFFVWALSNQ